MGELYVLSCNKCGAIQTHKTMSGCRSTISRKERFERNLSDLEKSEFKPLENSFPLTDKDFSFGELICKCNYCKKISVEKSFKVNLSKSFELVKPLNDCGNCDSHCLHSIYSYSSFSWDYLSMLREVLSKVEHKIHFSHEVVKAVLEDSLCTDCGHIGLNLKESAHLD